MRKLLVCIAFVAACGMRRLPAQEVYGGLTGRVWAGGGAASAVRVRLAGTAFEATTDAQGRYAIALVPAGEYEVMVQQGAGWLAVRPLIAVAPGEPTRTDLAIASDSVVATVTAAGLETSGLRLSGRDLRHQGVDDPRYAIARSPGVVMRDPAIGIVPDVDLSVRGGDRAQEATWIDGAPLRFQTAGGTSFTPGLNMISEEDVTTGVSASPFSDTRGGVVAYLTRFGSPRLSAGLHAESDGPFGRSMSVGFNRLTGEIGGPLGGHLLWFASATLVGEQSAYRGAGAGDQPYYLLAGVDTIVQEPVGGGPDSAPVTVPAFARRTGLYRPGDWTTNRILHGRALYTWGRGASLSLTVLSSSLQQRTFSQLYLLDPLLNPAARDWSNGVIVNWGQPLGGFRGGSLALKANLAISGDDERTGPLTNASELSTRNPAFGIELGSLAFFGDDAFQLPIDEAYLRRLRSNAGALVPYYQRQQQLAPSFFGRLNPYGVSGGFVSTQGVTGVLSRTSERRTSARAQVDWRRGASSITTIGIDADRTNLRFYQSNFFDVIGLDAFIEHPGRTGAFLQQRWTRGGLSLDLGVRYDRYAIGGLFSKTPGRVFSAADSATRRFLWNPNAPTDDTAYTNSLARVFIPGEAQSFLLPRIRFGYALSPRTAIRIGWGRQAEPPASRFQFAGSNTDLAVTNGSQLFGRSGVIGATTLLEFGLRHQWTHGLAIDASIYDKGLASYGGRVTQYYDPFYGSNQAAFLLARTDSRAWGADVGVEKRGSWITGSLAWSMIKASTKLPGLAGLVTYPSTTHSIYALVDVGAPERSAVRGFDAQVTVRATSGLPYTPVSNVGAGTVTPNTNAFASPTGPPNSARLPWTKTIDLRLTRQLRVAGQPWTLFADFRNLLDFKNVFALFAETGTTTNTKFESNLQFPQFAFLYSEAGTAVKPGGDIDLSSCASWGSRQADCVAVRRAEQRFGNGDGLYTVAEQTTAFNAWYDAFNGSSMFYGPGRTIRVGLELNR